MPKGTLVIRAAEQVGIEIPRFCDHPLLEPVGACRQCLVDIATPGPDGQLRPMPKPQASCTIEVTAGMVVKTQVTSPVADKAQQGVMELLLINHPLDCPVCDKGGECPLQNQAMSHGRGTSRFEDVKRTYPKPINISSQVLLDRERCVLCARCTRFSAQIAGDPFIELLERGALQQVGIYEQQPFESYFSGNTVQICPVGALTGAAYRFRSRPFDLVSTPGVCEHCASGCSIRSDHRRGQVLRRLAGNDPAVNEEWNCDKGRWAFTYSRAADRLTHPMVRDEETGELRVASWPEALEVAARGLAAAKAQGVGVLVGGRVTHEDAYAYAKFARVALGTNDIDFRARAALGRGGRLPGLVRGGHRPGHRRRDVRRPRGRQDRAARRLRARGGVADRLPAAAQGRPQARHRRSSAVAPWATRGLTKLAGRLVAGAPGHRGRGRCRPSPPAPRPADVGVDLLRPTARSCWSASGWRRLAGRPVRRTPRWPRPPAPRLAWVPRRAGERGALEAGALPDLLPGGRPVDDAAARVDSKPPGRRRVCRPQPAATPPASSPPRAGELGGLVVGGVDPADLPDPQAALAALDAAPLRGLAGDPRRARSPRGPTSCCRSPRPRRRPARSSTGRARAARSQAVLSSNAMSDYRVLDLLAGELDVHLGLRDLASIRAELAALGPWDGARGAAPDVGRRRAAAARSPTRPCWPPGGCCSTTVGCRTASPTSPAPRPAPVARLSAADRRARSASLDGADVVVSTAAGQITLPVVVDDLPDRVVWLPTDSQSVHGPREPAGQCRRRSSASPDRPPSADVVA